RMSDRIHNHWGAWLLARARYVGFHRHGDLAIAVGCRREQIARWGAMRTPPNQMRKGFDLSLSDTLQTTRSMIFSDWKYNAPDKTDRVFSGNVTSRITDRDLMTEVATRQRKAIVCLLEAIDTINKFKANSYTEVTKSELNSAALVMVYWMQMVTLFSPIQFANTIHSAMPGNDRPLEDFDIRQIMEKVNAIVTDPEFESMAITAMGEVPKRVREAMENMKAGILEGFLMGIPKPKGTSLAPSASAMMPARSAASVPPAALLPPSPAGPPARPPGGRPDRENRQPKPRGSKKK
ncbi:MAG: hypothetical protein WCI73_12535, partial [Phycisphaerae bacterium]